MTCPYVTTRLSRATSINQVRMAASFGRYAASLREVGGFLLAAWSRSDMIRGFTLAPTLPAGFNPGIHCLPASCSTAEMFCIRYSNALSVRPNRDAKSRYIFRLEYGLCSASSVAMFAYASTAAASSSSLQFCAIFSPRRIDAYSVTMIDRRTIKRAAASSNFCVASQSDEQVARRNGSQSRLSWVSPQQLPRMDAVPSGSEASRIEK
ncbi:hypothetical protein NA66_10202 [Burkholderia pyrrocinia]|uniref:Uncharacterized protein n=1 Tax=Burkholderia pyrrocinia TaxID=60550 RepID=A0A318I8Z9_BURPY|nr:hypothetical protein NA66_10202 [Burkholderia pyrrocinia]SFW80812.1 hypothetical protein SAMN03159384_05333 [Burkholderia sp. NFACC33-1]SFY43244.1 hypothetical protein SAMN03159408_05447 [Burkholderia sp. NFPP32]